MPAGLALPANKVFKVLKVLNDLKDPKDLKVFCWQSQTGTPDGGRHWNYVVQPPNNRRNPSDPKTQCGARKYVELGENGTVGVGGPANQNAQLNVY